MIARVDIPRWIPVAAAVGMALIVLPVIGMAGRVDWPRFWPLVTSDSSLAALGLSLRTATTSALLCVLLGVPMALWFARSRSRLVAILRAAVLLPLVLPPVVGGIALLSLFGRRGLLGPLLESLGVQIAFSTTAVILAQTFVALPFLVVSVEAALRTSGMRPAAVAATLGARPWTVLARVTLPALAPALAAGAVLSFARALGEFGATLTFAGSLEGVTRTLPLEIYLQREADPDAAIALSLVLVVVAVAVMAATGLASPVGSASPRGSRSKIQVPRTDTPGDAAAARRVASPDLNLRQGEGGKDAAGAAAGAPPATLAARIRIPERDVDVELEVGAGEVLALVGGNGAGKTSVVEAVAGLVPSAAAIALGGRDIGARPASARGVALVDQRPVLLTRGRVVDEAAFALRARGLSREAARAGARPALAATGLEHLAERRTTELSGGQIQRLAIARALVADPPLLILDEPFASLDAASVAAVRDVVEAQRGRRTTLIVTHDPVDALRLADRVTVLEAGRVVDAGPVAGVLGRAAAGEAAEATRAFAGGVVVSGIVRGGRLEAAAGPLAGASIPLPPDHGIPDAAAAVAVVAADEVVIRPA